MHGGASTGPRTPEGLERMRTAKTRHGLYGEGHRRLMRLLRMLDAATKGAIERS